MFIILSFSSHEERDKFEFLYEKYKNLMLHKAYGILRDYMRAEDAVSEAFLRIYKNLHKIEDPASNRSLAFVMIIVKNVALTMLERERRDAADEIDEGVRDPLDLERQALSDLSAERIYELLGQVNEEYRSVFVLKYSYDMSHKDIAAVLNTTENNVTVRLHRAKKRLSGLLEKEGYV